MQGIFSRGCPILAPARVGDGCLKRQDVGPASEDALLTGGSIISRTGTNPNHDRSGETRLAERLRTARLLGGDSALVLHGGGNVSFKGVGTNVLGESVEVIHVKSSGADLATLRPADLPALELAPLRRLRTQDSLTDEAMVNELRRCLLDATAPPPSIETLVHAFLPHRFVDHTHADAVIALSNRENGEALIREALGDRIGILPYVRPGFDLAKAVAELYEIDRTLDGIVLMQHGLLTFADDAGASYERHVSIVSACERMIEQRCGARVSLSIAPSDSAANANRRALQIAPILRGLLSLRTGDEDRPHRHCVLEWRGGGELLAILRDPQLREFAVTGPLTGDHALRTKPWPMMAEVSTGDDEAALRGKIEAAIAAFQQTYGAYVREQGGGVDGGDDLPTIVLVPDAGLFARGRTLREARIAADIAERTLLVKARTSALGPFRSLSHEHLFDMEFRPMQRAKRSVEQNRILEGQVVAISGGAGAIGADIADACVAVGAHVALADIDAVRLQQSVDRLRAKHGPDRVLAVEMDVTDERSVSEGFHRIVRTFGGVDVIVPNAGIAHVRPIAELAPDDFRRVYEVNALGCLLFMREGARILKTQGVGGSVVISASKNVFGPGKDFGAYSASKAAAHQLGKVGAIELAEFGIRVNMINADAIFGDDENPSGLWATVGPERAKSRNLSEADLAEYYRSRNLLKLRVRGHHVGSAVVFFASNQTPTTGATLPVDGGIVEAFPR